MTISKPAAPFRYTWIMQDWGVGGSNRSIREIIAWLEIASTSWWSLAYLCSKDPDKVWNCSPQHGLINEHPHIHKIMCTREIAQTYGANQFISIYYMCKTKSAQYEKKTIIYKSVKEHETNGHKGKRCKTVLSSDRSLASIQWGACVKTLPPKRTCQSEAKEMRERDEESIAPLIPPNPLYLTRVGSNKLIYTWEKQKEATSLLALRTWSSKQLWNTRKNLPWTNGKTPWHIDRIKEATQFFPFDLNCRVEWQSFTEPSSIHMQTSTCCLYQVCDLTELCPRDAATAIHAMRDLDDYLRRWLLSQNRVKRLLYSLGIE